MELFFYTTDGCHLCEQAEHLLVNTPLPAPVPVTVVDIAESPELVERYGIRMPVLQRSDSGEELGWPFTADELQAFLTKRPPC